MKRDVTFAAILLGLVSISVVYSTPNCCGKNVDIKNYRNCADGSTLLPKCDGYPVILNNAWNYFSHYIIRNDTKGEYLDDFVGGFIVRPPNSQRERYSSLEIAINESDNPEYHYSSWIWFDTFLNFLSCSFLAVAFYIYYLVIPTRQFEDVCLLNFAGSLSLSHAAFLYDMATVDGMLPDLCITSLYAMYFFVLSGFTWCTLFMYYIWKKYKSGVSVENTAILKQFRIIGYGAPALLMILVNIHAHASKLYSEYAFEMDCTVHQILIEDIYVFAPITLTVGSNCYFWNSLKKYTETTAIKTTEDEFNRNKINSLLTLNRRLLFAFGLPWLAYIIITGALEFITSSTLQYLLEWAVSATNFCGFIVALILVMSRARVWKCVIQKYENFQLLRKWQPSDEEESSILNDDGSFKISRTFPSDV